MNESIRLANALAAGMIPWRISAFPRNVRSGKPYEGVNPILLNAHGSFTSPWWGTAEDWKAVGNRLKPELGVGLPGSPGAVYNLDQTDRAYEPSPLPVEDADAVFSDIIKGLGVQMEHGFDSTCKYFGTDDRIRIPHKWMFEIGPGGASGWFDALGHELTHSSEPRLRWDGHSDVAELRAEIGSGYLCGLLGVTPLPRHLARHHDAHVGRWVRMMRADPSLLMRVCGSATEAVSYLLRFAGHEIKWHPMMI